MADQIFTQKQTDQFWPKTRRNENSGCIEWIASVDRDGYGRVKVGGRRCYAHRVSWLISRGPVPPGLLVLHSCDNPPCVNPAHLFVGTHGDNMADMMAKRRTGRPTVTRATHWWQTVRGAHGNAKIGPDDVRSARRLAANATSYGDIAKVTGISYSNVTRIVRGETWGWLP